jgi:hypothetical protein
MKQKSQEWKLCERQYEKYSLKKYTLLNIEYVMAFRD